jgi:hypothetical protein
MSAGKADAAREALDGCVGWQGSFDAEINPRGFRSDVVNQFRKQERPLHGFYGF